MNHIAPGKHYGFPPRHEEYLPDVTDEPPVVAFGPQHQSTCGLIFNEATAHRPSFGPALWEGDALVAGFSRGRLWRVRLVKTANGYVGRQIPIAISSMLLADVAVSPQGDLYVTCHSGPPDWGTGPQGEGRLVRLRITNRDAPQPVLAYSSGPLEVKVAFDRPIDPGIVDWVQRQTIRYGQHVRAGDQLEVLQPPYATVERQLEAHRGELKIVLAKLSDDGRTLRLQTAPHPLRGTFALSVPLDVPAQNPTNPASAELDYDLSGLHAEWMLPGSDRPAWTGWLPHVDLDIARAFCNASSEHELLFSHLQKPGTLKLAGYVDLPPDAVTLQLVSTAPCRMRFGEHRPLVSHPNEDQHGITADSTGLIGRQPLEVMVEHAGGDGPHLRLTYRRDSENNERVVELTRLSLPWTPPPMSTAIDREQAQPSQIAGDARRGELIFFGQDARCADCHSIHGRGAKLAPALNDLSQRSISSILRDIREPSATINPDFLSYTMTLKDGLTLSGTVRPTAGEQLLVVDQAARQSIVNADDVDQMAPQAISMMPTGLLDSLSESDVNDLLAFLVDSPPPGQSLPEFPQRTIAEVDAVLNALPADPQQPESKSLVITLVAGKKDHGPGEHDYPAWQASWAGLLRQDENVVLERAMEWPTAQQWRSSNVVIFYLWNHDWSPQRLSELDDFLEKGGGVVALHAGVISDDDPEALAQRWGLAAQPKRTKYRHGPVTLRLTGTGTHELLAGYSKLALIDETYWPLVGDRQKVDVLATAVEEDAEWPMIWTFRPGNGRVWASVIGHYSATLEDPLYRILILRGIAWAADQPISRLQRLVKN